MFLVLVSVMFLCQVCVSEYFIYGYRLFPNIPFDKADDQTTSLKQRFLPSHIPLPITVTEQVWFSLLPPLLLVGEVCALNVVYELLLFSLSFFFLH